MKVVGNLVGCHSCAQLTVKVVESDAHTHVHTLNLPHTPSHFTHTSSPCTPHTTLLVHPLTSSHLTHITGGHRNLQEEKDKMMAAQIVAIERAQMTARR